MEGDYEWITLFRPVSESRTRKKLRFQQRIGLPRPRDKNMRSKLEAIFLLILGAMTLGIGIKLGQAVLTGFRFIRFPIILDVLDVAIILMASIYCLKGELGKLWTLEDAENSRGSPHLLHS